MDGIGKKPIPLALKRECLQHRHDGRSCRWIYNNIFHEQHPQMGFGTFQHHILRWDRQHLADEDTLHAGTFPQFTAHGATVQVNANGEITQAWIKQTADQDGIAELISAIRESTEPQRINRMVCDGIGMLEIPLWDMHFPLSGYTEVCAELLDLIERRTWAQIVIIIGQDLFHNDDFRSRTSSGRQIECVDMVEAWRKARRFWYAICDAALRNASSVKLIYSVGNHDESMAWAFVQLLKERYPQISVDDSLAQRKVIAWEKCFIGVTHGANKASTNQDLRGQFTVEFPREFANATVREIHAGHLHHEKTGDLYGVMVRRLSSGVPTDKWSSGEGYVGAHKRFMVFEWLPEKLKAVYYL